MLIEFKVGNFRSFKEPVTLSMVAAKLNAKEPALDLNNTFQVGDGLTLLSSAAIYGANASGKSNLIKAFRFMRNYILSSSKESQVDEPINTIPYRLDINFEHKPSFFEVVFLLEDVLYRYGFEVTTERVDTEWLFYSPKGKEAKLFVRDGNEISLSRTFKGGQALKSLTRSNALFLSVAAQFNNQIATKVLGWFKSMSVISGLNDAWYQSFSTRIFTEDPSYKQSMIDFIRGSDVGINNVVAETLSIQDPAAFPKGLPKEWKDFLKTQFKGKDDIVKFKSYHLRYCENNTAEEIPFEIEDESDGTQRLFFLSGPIINTLREGRILVIDEIEVSLHTLLIQRLISLFNSTKTNPHHAQLVFATHDTNLLSNKLFRRDQVWFVEKDEQGASHLYSLAELKVRNTDLFANDYIKGKYGAIPILGEMRQLMRDHSEDEVQNAE